MRDKLQEEGSAACVQFFPALERELHITCTVERKMRAAGRAIDVSGADMTWEAWLSIGVVGLVIALLALTRFAADVVLVAGVTLLLLFGVLSPAEALAGLSATHPFSAAPAASSARARTWL